MYANGLKQEQMFRDSSCSFFFSFLFFHSTKDDGWMVALYGGVFITFLTFVFK